MRCKKCPSFITFFLIVLSVIVFAQNSSAAALVAGGSHASAIKPDGNLLGASHPRWRDFITVTGLSGSKAFPESTPLWV